MKVGLEVPIVPMRDDVFVEIHERRVSDLILTPDHSRGEASIDKSMPVRGKVLAVGPKQADVVPGDTIQFYFGGIETYYPANKSAIVGGKFIQAVLEP